MAQPAIFPGHGRTADCSPWLILLETSSRKRGKQLGIPTWSYGIYISGRSAQLRMCFLPYRRWEPLPHDVSMRVNERSSWCSVRTPYLAPCQLSCLLYLENGCAPSTLKVYVAAIAVYHQWILNKPVGKCDLVITLQRGARWMNPPWPPTVPTWDLLLVLRALVGPPFEPLQSADFFAQFKHYI